MNQAPAPEIQAALTDMCGPDVGVGVQVTGDDAVGLFPEESAAIARAIEKRRAEFKAGRGAARLALGALGCRPVAIPMASDRAPVWPKGFTGSISHSGGIAVAIAVADPTTGLGVDIDKATPLDEKLWPTLLLTSERDWLTTMPKNQRGIMAKHLFSIKECVYKAQYSRSQTVLNFSAFAVTLAPNGDFAACFQIDCHPFTKGTHLHGSARKIGRMILSTTRL